MAEEQVMSQVLVLDSNREKLAKRIKNVELDLRDELSKRQKIAFCNVFVELCEKYFKFRKSDLLKITDNVELLALELEVFKKAERSYKITKYFVIPFLALIPIFGWCMVFDMFDLNQQRIYERIYGDFSFHYYRLRRKLIETHDKEFFPFDTLKQVLTN